MGTLPAITADSLGNRTAVALGLPPLTRTPGDQATRQNLMRWVAIQDRDPPGQWTDDAWQQANSFHSAVYIAVNTIMTAMGISPKTEFDIEGRPFYVTEDGKGRAVTELFA